MIGVQLTRLLRAHPRIDAVKPFSRRHAGTPVSGLHPALRDLNDLKFHQPTGNALGECDAIMLCVSDYDAYLPALQELKGSVIDLGSGFRLSTADRYQDVHEKQHPGSDVLDRFVSVVPELNPEQWQTGNWVASQGCVSTAVALALHPIIRAGLLADDFVNVDAKVSSTGAGSTASYAQMHFNRCNGVKAYRLLDEHRHSAELEDFMLRACSKQLKIHVNVFSVDLVRGISAATYVRLLPGTDERAIRRVLNDAYRAHPTVRVLKLPSGEERYPNPKWLTGTGICEIGFRVDPESGRAVFISALDNLMKGGASQGVQLLNLMNNFAPTDGIPLTTAYP